MEGNGWSEITINANFIRGYIANVVQCIKYIIANERNKTKLGAAAMKMAKS